MNIKPLLIVPLFTAVACFAAEPSVGVAEANFLAVDADRIPALTADAQWKIGEPIPQGATTIRRYFNVAEGFASPLVVVHLDAEFKGKDLEKFLASFLDAALKGWGIEHKLVKATTKISGESFLVFRIEGTGSKQGTDGVFYCTSNARTIVVSLIGASTALTGYRAAFESGFKEVEAGPTE